MPVDAQPGGPFECAEPPINIAVRGAVGFATAIRLLCRPAQAAESERHSPASAPQRPAGRGGNADKSAAFAARPSGGERKTRPLSRPARAAESARRVELACDVLLNFEGEGGVLRTSVFPVFELDHVEFFETMA
jgi:hypothetical protein